MPKKEDDVDSKPIKKGSCPVKGCDGSVTEKAHPTIPHIKTVRCSEHGEVNVQK